MHAAFNVVHAFDSWPPKRGPNGSLVTGSDIDWRNEFDEYHFGPPARPTRTVDVYDEEGEPCGYRDLTDEEFASVMVVYEKRRRYYEETGGIHRVSRPPNVNGVFKCEDGSVAKAWGDGSSWRWVAFDSAPTKKAPLTS